jgi:hypothetical protein
MVYTVRMTDFIKRLSYGDFLLGDICRCTSAVLGSKGRRYKFLGAVFDAEDDTTPLYLELADMRSGNVRSIKPEFVIKQVAPSKAARARRERKEAK